MLGRRRKPPVLAEVPRARAAPRRGDARPRRAGGLWGAGRQRWRTPARSSPPDRHARTVALGLAAAATARRAAGSPCSSATSPIPGRWPGPRSVGDAGPARVPARRGRRRARSCSRWSSPARPPARRPSRWSASSPARREPEPVALLDSERCDHAIQELRRAYGLLAIDGPGLGEDVHSLQALSEHAGATIVCGERREIPQRAAGRGHRASSSPAERSRSEVVAREVGLEPLGVLALGRARRVGRRRPVAVAPPAGDAEGEQRRGEDEADHGDQVGGEVEARGLGEGEDRGPVLGDERVLDLGLGPALGDELARRRPSRAGPAASRRARAACRRSGTSLRFDSVHGRLRGRGGAGAAPDSSAEAPRMASDARSCACPRSAARLHRPGISSSTGPRKNQASRPCGSTRKFSGTPVEPKAALRSSPTERSCG